MKRKIIMKILLCALCTSGIVFVSFICIWYICAQHLDLREVPTASRDLSPRTQITEDDLTMIRIPGRYLMDNAFATKEEVIGKYTEIQGMIPKGSPFYRSMLKDEKDLPDHPALELQDGQAVYTVPGDAASLGTLKKGMRVDLHLSVQTDDHRTMTGRLLRNARILSVRDHQGYEMEDQAGSGVPYMVELAVNKEDIDLLMLAEMNGTIRFFASADSYDSREGELDENSEIVRWLREKSDSR